MEHLIEPAPSPELIRDMAAVILGLLGSKDGPPRDAHFWAKADAVLHEIRKRRLHEAK